MHTINTKVFSTQYGNVEYYQSSNPNQEYSIVFIHGLGQNKDWFKEQYERYNLNQFSWIVPDLLGYGKSDQPKQELAYTMENQANMIHKLLIEEKINRVVIFAHSMGGPIAISLIEELMKIQNQNSINIKVLGLFYLEGNLDRGDADFSSIIAKKTLDDFETNFESFLQEIITEFGSEIQSYCDKLKLVGPYPLWASSKDLVHHSYSNELLPRLQKCLHFPVYFIFGEDNKGLLSSEELIKESKLPIIFIPNAGHGLHLGNPSDFWQIIKKIISKII
ncbi:alpha/beta fold hydrolase [Promethearchaeum syntrophicum]|uniref:Alpha/beta fold hydrolase n=1 Tax=Promethearchaeum syntrophicum TaxID=2594042 RepID=A0A5B9D5K1_9ARCH|nr:alpha/beta hydrolase [Candidatus Prometheoarchaeum syntrophicum]QEE14398.1 2-succinyl-6-hydroxy-2,4-cyclohexadiene-1-carboxylate synthase [Candidatus Prometheoarchaeum syntrophicum]